MTFRAFFWRWVRLLFAIHGFLGLLGGYWDMRLSDTFLYQGQMSRIHYYRTLQLHLALAIVVSFALALHLARKHWNRTREIDRQQVIPTQIAFAISYLLLLIVGIKLHLVWLQTHFTDPEGLLWTGALVAGCLVLYALSWFVVSRIASRQSASRTAAIAFLLLAAGTAADAYLRQTASHRGYAKSSNVLLVVADTLRWDHVSTYGYSHSTTPRLDRLASEGAVYELAFAASPWTTPSHAAMFTGQYPSRNGVDGRNIYLNPEASTLAGHLTRHGFQTAGFINNVYIRRQTGIGRGFQQYEEFWGRNEGSSLPLLLELLRDRLRPRQDTGAQETRQSVEDWLNKDWNGTNPFFLFVHFMEPHAPYGVPATFLPQFLPAHVTPDQARQVNQDPELFICHKVSMTPKDFEILNALYDNDIRYLDDQIGKLLDSLRQRGVLDNTLVIFVSDHGEHFGDHGLMSHELSIYDSLIRVPLILRHPASIPAGTRISNVVQTVDLFPSILRFTHVPSGSLQLQGASLLPRAMDRAKQPFAFAEYNNARAVDKIQRRFPGFSNPLFRMKTLRAVRSADLKLIVGSDGSRELYNMKADPGETNNLYSQSPEEARILEAVLNKWSASFQASRFYRQEDISKEALDELRALGYVQ